MFDEKVEQSRALLMASKVEHEFRTTVFSHLDDSDFERIGEWLNGASRYFLQLGKNAQPILDETFNNRHQRVTRESLEPVRRRLKHYISEVSVR